MFQPIIEGVPSEFEIAGDKPTITIPLTFDGDSRALLEVRLWPQWWGSKEVDELEFVIIVYDERSEEPEEVWDRYKAAAYVESVRELVMECVCEATKSLVDSVQPSVIVMRTWVEQPHPKSLPKYDKITDTLGNLGYETMSEGYGPTGRRFWVLGKDGGAS